MSHLDPEAEFDPKTPPDTDANLTDEPAPPLAPPPIASIQGGLEAPAMGNPKIHINS